MVIAGVLSAAARSARTSFSVLHVAVFGAAFSVCVWLVVRTRQQLAQADWPGRSNFLFNLRAVSCLAQRWTNMRKMICLAAVLAPLVAFADANDSIATESRDAASAYIGTNNFIVGRMAVECFGVLERSLPPQEYATQWRQRNAKFYVASITYMGQRLKAAEQSGGPAAMEALRSKYSAAVRGDGAATVADFFKKGEKTEVCRRVIGLIDGGAFDIKPNSPMYPELLALVEYIEN